MRFIPTAVHGVMDYIVGLALIAAPFVLGFNNNGPAMWVPIILGLGMIVYSIFTDYELGLVRVLPMKAHLGIDAIGGLFLLASPWLFGFADYVWIPHVVVGAAALVSALVTDTVPVARPMMHNTPPRPHVHP